MGLHASRLTPHIVNGPADRHDTTMLPGQSYGMPQSIGAACGTVHTLDAACGEEVRTEGESIPAPVHSFRFIVHFILKTEVASWVELCLPIRSFRFLHHFQKV